MTSSSVFRFSFSGSGTPKTFFSFWVSLLFVDQRVGIGLFFVGFVVETQFLDWGSLRAFQFYWTAKRHPDRLGRPS